MQLMAIDPEEQLATRAAWLYFVAGLTQAQIGKKLGLNRTRVNRLLAQARDHGLVQINITGRLASCVELEERLRQHYGLDDAVVVPTPPDQDLIPQVIATAAAAALSSRLKDGMSVGVGWGRTLRLSIQSVPRRQLSHLSVVSLLGGLTRGSAMNPHETASHLADLVGAQCYYVAAPALTDTESTRDVLAAQPMLREIFEKGAKVDLAFLSVGELTASCTMTRVGLVSRAEVDDLIRAGAVGDICAHWIDREGRIVDHPLNKRVVALSPERLPDIPCVMIASGGRTKVEALRGVLKGGMCDVIITDEQTAKSILAMDKT
ncbi:sugar-binding transcriptional regulator [Aestuariivirga sp.]|uniref:sugar-binding transcriptional regulator n=1 Tax=Aestuariivirga sp. TaxID=2650926 RepID=UPI003BA98F20